MSNITKKKMSRYMNEVSFHSLIVIFRITFYKSVFRFRIQLCCWGGTPSDAVSAVTALSVHDGIFPLSFQLTPPHPQLCIFSCCEMLLLIYILFCGLFSPGMSRRTNYSFFVSLIFARVSDSTHLTSVFLSFRRNVSSTPFNFL